MGHYLGRWGIQSMNHSRRVKNDVSFKDRFLKVLMDPTRQENLRSIYLSQKHPVKMLEGLRPSQLAVYLGSRRSSELELVPFRKG